MIFRVARAAICLALLAVLVALPGGGCGKRAEPCNVVVIVLDALRQDHVGAYGYHRDTTPHIDRFATEAVVSRRAWANCSWTSPSVASLFTGLYPSVHGATDYYGTAAGVLVPGLETLAEALRDRGYATAAFVANSWLDPRLGFDQGFDVFDGIAAKPKPRAAELNARALAWLEEPPAGPFFLYLHYMDPHGPYWAPAPYNKAFRADTTRALTAVERRRLGYLRRDLAADGNDLNHYIDHYDGEILYADAHVGEILAHLDAAGLRDDTIVVITADHGESFFEHGHCDHGHTVFEEEIAVPLIWRFPPRLARTPEVAGLADRPVQLVDLAPTLLGAVGGGFDRATSGRDLLAPTKGPAEPAPVWAEELAAEFKGPPKLALRQGDHKVIHDLAADTLLAVFDLAADPGEQTNLLTGGAGRAPALAEAITDHFARSAALHAELDITADTTAISEELRGVLKSLGYTN